MRLGSTLAGWAALIGLASLVGCGSDSLFQCQSDPQCVLDGSAGTCQANGYCSFDDTDCDSGLRYGDSAPPGLAGLCVDAEPDPTTSAGSGTTGCALGDCSTTAPSTTAATSSSMADSTSAPPLTSATDDASGTMSSATDSGTTTDASTGAGDSSSGEGATTTAVRCPEVLDEFNNAVLDESPWVVMQSTPPSLSESGETLQFAVMTDVPGYAFLDLPARSLTDGYVVVHLTALPQDDVSQFLLRAFGPEEQSVELVLSNNNTLDVRVLGASVASSTIDDSTSEIWLEIFGDAGELNFAYSLNGDDFFELHNQAAPFALDNVDISMMGGSYAAITEPEHVIGVDDFEYCGQPFSP